MNDKERQMYEAVFKEAVFKIERNIDILKYVSDSILEGNGMKTNSEQFGGAVLEIILNLKESIDMIKQIVKRMRRCGHGNNSKTWQFSLYEYLTNNEITAEQYLKICDVLGILISELN